MWLAIFVIVTFLLIALPLIPGVMELQLATDIKPLKVTQDYDSNIQHFAIGFKSYIEKNFAGLYTNTPLEHQAKEGILRDKTPFVVTGLDNKLVLDSKESKKGSVKRLVVAESDIAIEDNLLFESEIYSKSSVTTGIKDRFRAILAEKDITLGERNIVYRWVHSGNNLIISNGCHLYGRASAEEEIHINGNCDFERLNAKKIIFGNAISLPTTLPGNLEIIDKLPHVRDLFERRWLINGNVKIPPNSMFDGDIIASKSITIGAGSVIKGSVKATKHLILEEGAIIKGSAVSAGDITTADKCMISEPVIAEGNITIGSNNILGSNVMPVTVTAEHIKIHGGTVVYGTIRAEAKALAVITTVKT